MYKRELIGKQKQYYKSDIVSADFYKYYRNQYMKVKSKLINKSSPYYLSYAQYISIIERFNILLRDKMLYESKEVNLPMRMGSLCIKKAKPKLRLKNNKVISLPINWKATNDLWASDEDSYIKKRFIRYTNEHSKGWIASVFWDKSNCTATNKKKYSFESCRTFKLLINSIMTDEDSTIDYLEVKPYIPNTNDK